MRFSYFISVNSYFISSNEPVFMVLALVDCNNPVVCNACDFLLRKELWAVREDLNSAPLQNSSFLLSFFLSVS